MDAIGSGEYLTLSSHLDSSAVKALRGALDQPLKRSGFRIEDVDENSFVITPSRGAIEAEATKMGIRKRLDPAAQIQQGVEYDAFDESTRDVFEHVDSDTFFTPSEISMLTHRVLSGVLVDDQCLATIQPLKQAKHTKLGQPLIRCLVQDHLLEDVMPIHDPDFQRALMPSFWSPFPASSQLQAYYGDAVALYFDWMHFMIVWLAVPALAGISIYVIHKVTGETVEDSHYAPVFSVGMILWAVLATKFWQRREATLSVHWGTAWSAAHEEIRPDFTGQWRMSPVTGQPELYFAGWRRWPRYAVSVVVTGAMLSCAFTVMICSLNLQGYIQDPEDEFYFSALAPLAAPGGLFHPGRLSHPGLANALLPRAPMLLHAAGIFLLNQVVYRRVAERLTAFENHRTERGHRASLVLKRFLFEAFDCYVALFYLAFWQLDILKVRAELLGLFTADCVRRLVTEVALPWLLQMAGSAARSLQLSRIKAKIGDKPALVQALVDTQKEEHDDFDDYIEMIIQFGYVCLFAAAMPVAAAIACLYTVIERRSDLVKLLYLTRRPAAERTLDIGAWKHVMQVQASLAIVTNCIVFAFSSDQVMEYAPELFRTLRLPRGGVEKVVAEGAGRWLVTIWVLLEHSIALLALLLWLAIPSVPADVQQELDCVRYLEQKEAQESRHRERQRLAAEAKATSGGKLG